MQNKRLLFFASDFSIGLSSLLTDQLCAIQDAGINVVAVAGENEQEPGLSKILAERGANLIRMTGLDAHADFKRLVSEIAKIVKENSIQVIHVQNNWQLAIAAAVKAKLLFSNRVKIVYTLHGFRHNHPVKSRIAQIVIGSALFVAADNVICMTEYLKRKFSLLSYKIKLIPLGIKEDYFIDEFIAPPTYSLHLVFPAQFRHGKNQDMIMRAFKKYVEQTNDQSATLTLPGNGPLLDDMKTLARDLGISDKVRFPGFVSKDDVKRLYLESNVAIVASNSETFGQSIVEPFVLGRCVLSTPVGIAPEIISDGINGYIYKTEDELTYILCQLNKNRNLLVDIGKHNFAARDKFRWREVIERYANNFVVY